MIKFLNVTFLAVFSFKSVNGGISTSLIYYKIQNEYQFVRINLQSGSFLS